MCIKKPKTVTQLKKEAQHELAAVKTHARKGNGNQNNHIQDRKKAKNLEEFKSVHDAF